MTTESGPDRGPQAPERRRGSLRVVRLFGIGVYLHWSWLGIAFLLLLAFRGQLAAAYPGLTTGRAWTLAVLGSFALLASVLIHELAHALVAGSRGIEVEAITLHLFGGATEADASSQTALDELMIAIVGPLTS
ncbi:MAG: site-2 protease family protein, partial [Actinomycetota bacterium]